MSFAFVILMHLLCLIIITTITSIAWIPTLASVYLLLLILLNIKIVTFKSNAWNFGWLISFNSPYNTLQQKSPHPILQMRNMKLTQVKGRPRGCTAANTWFWNPGSGPGVSKLQPMGQPLPSTCFCKHGVWGHSHAHSFMYYPWLLSHCTGSTEWLQQRLYGPWCLKYLLSEPSQKTFADPALDRTRGFMYTETLGIPPGVNSLKLQMFMFTVYIYIYFFPPEERVYGFHLILKRTYAFKKN